MGRRDVDEFDGPLIEKCLIGAMRPPDLELTGEGLRAAAIATSDRGETSEPTGLDSLRRRYERWSRCRQRPIPRAQSSTSLPCLGARDSPVGWSAADARQSAGTVTCSPGVGNARTIWGGHWTLPMMVKLVAPEQAGMLFARKFMLAKSQRTELDGFLELRRDAVLVRRRDAHR